MQSGSWRERARQSAAELVAQDEDALTEVSRSSTTTQVHLDGIHVANLSLVIVESHRRDGKQIVQHNLALACRFCGNLVYTTHEYIQLDDLGAARSNMQLHLTECSAIGTHTAKKEAPEQQPNSVRLVGYQTELPPG